MPGKQLFENGGTSSSSLPSKFKKPKLNAFRRFPANCGPTPAPLAALFDATHLKPNALAESALGYSTIALGNSPFNIKMDLAGQIPENLSLFDNDYEEGQIANTTDNTAHQKEELWKHASKKLAAVMSEAKGFLNLLYAGNSTAKTFTAMEDSLKDSRESKDQLPSLEPDAYHPHTSSGEHKPILEIKKQEKRERVKFLDESVMLKNLDSRISVVVQEEKASGTETMWEDIEDEPSLLSPTEWNALQLPVNHKDECAKPSIGILEKKLERQSSLKFSRECGNVIEPEGVSIVHFIDSISVGTKSDKPSEQIPDCELTETRCKEHQGHGSMDLDESSTIAIRVQDELSKIFPADDEAIAIPSHRSINATSCNDEPEYIENNKKLINLEIVQHDQPQGRKVMQALKLFKEEYVKLMHNHELELRGETSTRYPHLEAANHVKAKGMYISLDKPFGHIPGIEIGDEFSFRSELAIVGLHRHLIAGIHYVTLGGKKYASSVVNSGRYENKATSHDILIYTGQGGNPKVSHNAAAADQKLEKGNLALVNSMEMGYPVRVIHKRKLVHASKALGMNYERNIGYVYEGLYTVNKFWHEREDLNNKLVFKFELQRMPGQPSSLGTDFESEKLIPTTEICVLDDVSEGKENFKVRVVNEVDDELPLPFTYITSIVYPHWYQRIEPIGCNCINGCSDSEKCPCVVKNGGEIPFTEIGVIMRAYPNIVHECGPSCKCPPSCMNRVSQQGPCFQLEIFKTKSMGWGVRSRDLIVPGSFICEYIGEILGDNEADQRIGNEYLFDICHSNGEEGDDFSLDAAKCGNISRFINHSCDPNVFSQEILYDNDDTRMPHIMFFAAECIPAGQELMYDYNYRNNVGDANGNIKTKACHCGSRSCTGRMY